MELEVKRPIIRKYDYKKLPQIHWLDTIDQGQCLMEVSPEFVQALNTELKRMFKQQYCDDSGDHTTCMVNFSMKPDGSIIVYSAKGKGPRLAELRLTCVSLGY